jgi:hypothetical protein
MHPRSHMPTACRDEEIIKPPETSRPGAVICIGGSTPLPPAFQQQHHAVAFVRKTQDLMTSDKRKAIHSPSCGSEGSYSDSAATEKGFKPTFAPLSRPSLLNIAQMAYPVMHRGIIDGCTSAA